MKNVKKAGEALRAHDIGTGALTGSARGAI